VSEFTQFRKQTNQNEIENKEKEEEKKEIALLTGLAFAAVNETRFLRFGLPFLPQKQQKKRVEWSEELGRAIFGPQTNHIHLLSNFFNLLSNVNNKKKMK
jgi:hypothetical protein